MKLFGSMRPGAKFWVALLIAVVGLAGCVRSVHGGSDAGEKIRVLVARGFGSIEVRGARSGELVIERLAPGYVSVNGDKKDLPLKIIPAKKALMLNSRAYYGTIEIIEDNGALLAVNELRLEAYISGIVGNEVSSSWDDGVLKAQAVIARTYALYQKRKKASGPFHVEATVMGQVYSGADADGAVVKAVRATSGEVLLYDGKPALTVYHANAGGMTEASKDVWQKDYPYLRPVKSPFDSSAPQFKWSFAISAVALGQKLKDAGHDLGEPAELVVEELSSGGRVLSVFIKDGSGSGVRVSGEDLRRALGYNALKSAIFEVSNEGGVFVFNGQGSGHGVGLSQWGAKVMAEQGYSYKKILSHYYPGTKLVRAY